MTTQSTVDLRCDPPVERRRCVHTRRPTGIRGVKRSIEATYADEDSGKQAKNRKIRVDDWIYWLVSRPGWSRAQINWEIPDYWVIWEDAGGQKSPPSAAHEQVLIDQFKEK